MYKDYFYQTIKIVGVVKRVSLLKINWFLPVFKQNELNSLDRSVASVFDTEKN